MKNLFDAATTDEVKNRIARLRPDSKRLWGRMSVAQAMAHCSGALEMAAGDTIPLRLFFLPRLIGRMVKPLALGDDKPLRRNSPTMKNLIVGDERDLEVERVRLCGLIDRFAGDGPGGCTKEAHSFFGRLRPEEWAVLMYKHLDHHLRQFGV